jgi:SAM-dependent methyltransferase
MSGPILLVHGYTKRNKPSRPACAQTKKGYTRMRRLDAEGYDLANNLLVSFTQIGYWLTPGTPILDYGCGAGNLVYRLRDLGFDAQGFDIHDYVSYRSPEDRTYFRFIENTSNDRSDMVVDWEQFRVPYEDSAFDVVISSVVMEHVLNLDAMMSEISRVLRPSGFSFHIYPRRSLFIEPHMSVPFGTRTQSWLYFYLWALLGSRNELNDSCSAREVAVDYYRYSRTGVSYLKPKELLATCYRYFDDVQFADAALNYQAKAKDLWRNRRNALKAANRLRALSLTQLMSALFTACPKKTPQSTCYVAPLEASKRICTSAQVFGRVK